MPECTLALGFVMPPSHPAAKPSPTRAVAESIEDLLVHALNHILQEARAAGNWGDVRGTSDSLIAIQTCLPPSAYPRLRAAACRWLAGRSIAASDMHNWEEEVWDTSVALLALSGDPVGSEEVIAGGLRWLEEHHRYGHDNWNDEPWETLWALLAIHATRRATAQRIPSEIPHRSLRWLLSLLDSPKQGLLVSWHYTGLFVLVAGRYATADMLTREGPTLVTELRDVVQRVVAGMVATLAAAPSGDELWTREIWSSSLVLWAASENEAIRESSPGLSRVVDWYRKRLDSDDLMTEDCAFACIALFHLLVSIETTRHSIVLRALEELRERVLAQKEAALATELIDAHEMLAADRVRERVARRLAATCSDYVARPPFVTASDYPGYYSIHAHAKSVNVALIVLFTTGITFLTASKDFLSVRMSHWATLIPIALGVFATIAQLVNVDFRSLLSRGRKSSREQG